MPSDAADFYFSGVTKDNCPSPRWRAVKDLGVWQEGLKGRSYKGTGILCTVWKGYVVIFDDMAGLRFYSRLNHTHTRAREHTHTAFMTRRLWRTASGLPFLPQNSDIITNSVDCTTHATRTSKWVSVSRTFWFMRKKHNRRQGVMWVTFNDYFSYCLFSLSPLAFSFFVPFCPFLLWSF